MYIHVHPGILSPSAPETAPSEAAHPHDHRMPGPGSHVYGFHPEQLPAYDSAPAPWVLPGGVLTSLLSAVLLLFDVLLLFSTV